LTVSSMQNHFTIARAKLCCGDARERWQEPAHRKKYAPPADTPPIYTAPPPRPKVRHHFRPFEIPVQSYSSATTLRDVGPPMHLLFLCSGCSSSAAWLTCRCLPPLGPTARSV
jgi:hypothetical protein